MKKSFKAIASAIFAVVMTVETVGTGVLAAAAETAQPVCKELPGTTSTESSFSSEFLSVMGFAKGYVNDRTDVIGTDRYRVVKTAGELLQALEDAKTDRVDVIEIAADLDLGWNALTSKEQSYSCINEYGWDIHAEDGINNPYIEESGVSQITISNTEGLTIFSQGGCKLEHAEWKLQGTSSDIVIRNLKFDEMWRWSEAASSWDAGWTLLKMNGVKGLWIDHCTFTLGADGNVDSENGASNLTMSWCVQSLPATETPGTDSMLYRVITYMEYKYQQGMLAADSRYKLLRDNGATVEQILAYSAYHQGLNMNGSGEKDFTDGFDNAGNNLQDGNYRIHITYAYDKVNNIGARFPLIRQGTAHIVNCFIDNSGHMALHNDKSLPFNTYGKYGLNRGADARDGGCVGVDTSVFLQARPFIGSERQDENYNNMPVGFNVAFSGVYNHSLAVNSKVTNGDREYMGCSWDNNGDNLFFEDPASYWVDRSTIGHWKWFSSIDNREQYTKGIAPKDENGNYVPFSFSYSDGPLPYSYLKLPLDEVETTIDAHAGAYTYRQGPEFWLRTTYTEEETFATADTMPDVQTETITLSQETMEANVGETRQLVAKVTPAYAANREVTWTSSDPDCVEVLDSGLMIMKKNGSAVITATTKDGTELSASCAVNVSIPVKSLKIKASSKTLYLGDETTAPETMQLEAVITPADATNQKVIWTSSNSNVVSVDENGVLTPLKKGSNVTISCESEANPDIYASVRISVKEGVNPNPPTEPPVSAAPTDTPKPVQTDVPSNPPVQTWYYGDVNKNGEVTAEDALHILKVVVKLETLDESDVLAQKLADMDADGQVTAADALRVLRIVVQLDPQETFEW